MHENVVAAFLSEHVRRTDRSEGRYAEDRFYERFAYRAPRWLATLLAYVRGS